MGFFRLIGWPRYPQAGLALLFVLLMANGWYTFRTQPTFRVLGESYAQYKPAPQSPSVDCRVVACLALTFDDGPHSQVTPVILDILKRHQVKATFFVLGSQVTGRETIVQQQVREGHEVGNHSWNHPNMTKISSDEAISQIERTSKILADSHVPAPRLLRPPYGAVNDAMLARLNLPIIRWNVDPEDWRHQDAAYLSQAIMATAKPGSIILLHDIYPTTAAALEQVLETLKQQYQFVTVSQLLNLTAGEQGQFFSQYK